jgi:hypothetical protein
MACTQGIARSRQAFLPVLGKTGGVQVLSNIVLHVDLLALKRFVGAAKGAEASQLLPQLAAEAESLAQPRILCKASVVERTDGDVIQIDGVEFRSGLLVRLLKEGQRVYPFVLTIGAALEQRAASTERLWNHLVLDAMGTLLVSSLSRHLETVLKEEYGLSKFSRFSPGSLEAWPLTEQRPLFALLGDVEGRIGVKLNASCFMIPKKSLSGMYVATKEAFLSCRLCSMTACPGRRARFSSRLRRVYGLA